MDSRHALAAALLAAATPAGAAAGPPSTTAAEPPSGTTAAPPSTTQIRRALAAAERSPGLWATVNICDTRHHPRQLGLRGQMPGLGLRASLYMTFEVYYRSGGRLRRDRGATQRLSLGTRSDSTLHQAGITFTFTSPAVLKGRVLFTWKRAGRVIGQIARWTTGHHRHVDFADPPGHSAALCTIR